MGFKSRKLILGDIYIEFEKVEKTVVLFHVKLLFKKNLAIFFLKEFSAICITHSILTPKIYNFFFQ